MPTYVCTTVTGALDDAKRLAIAAAISTAHSDATGAPRFFVQVVFQEAGAGRRFLGGTPVDGHVWIRGDVRAGRAVDVRKSLMRAIMGEVATIMGRKDSDVWVYLNELEPTDMIEYGHVLPPPGEEAAWFASLPEALRDDLQRLGTSGATFRL